MTPPTDIDEAKTREEIDAKLEAAGWVIQDKKKLNLFEKLGVAVREMDTDTGPADYMLFIDGKACGIVEAKREGTNLGDVVQQSNRYAVSKTKHVQRWLEKLPFTYEATNHEVRFCNWRDPYARSRNLFHFHRPETLHNWLQQEDTLRARLQNLPELDTENLRDCQVDAIAGIEKSLKLGHPRALLQMATGAGKTFTAVTEVYRLAKFAKANRILFLVDRGNLGRQAFKEFQQYTVPNDGRKFTNLYNVHQLGTTGIGDEIKVTISTIQRLYSQLSGKELDEDADERSGYEVEASIANKQPRPVSYNSDIPIEAFDLIIIDECHRSIYNLWRQVLEYFDAFLIGLTATPTKKTIGYFNQNLVSEYTHEDAVIDKVNVGYDIYRIKTKKSEDGDLLEAGTAIEIRDRMTKAKRLEVLDQDEDYTKTDLDRSVISDNQIRTVIKAFKEKSLTECFPERDWVPKTLIFAKDDDHADRIVDVVREVFSEDNNFCKKITYKIGKKTAEDTIAEFRTSPRLRIAVTVDMVATGTDIKPLECIIFMRDVKSQAYYEQMKGRGTRVIDYDEFSKVTPKTKGKTRFVLIDAVGVTETDKTETRSLESKPSIPTDKLMEQIARGDRDPDTLRSLGNRLLRLDIKLNDQQRKQFDKVAGKSLALIAGELIHATNEDLLEEKAIEKFGTDTPTTEQRSEIYNPLADEVVKPFHNPDLRVLINELRRDTDQLIDDTADELISAEYDEEKAESLINNWQQFIQDHKNELDAIQLIYQQPYQKRHLSYDMINQLVEEIEQPPYHIAPVEVWKAYEQLKKAKVRGAPPETKLPILISLIRLATGVTDILEPFTEIVNNRFENWLKQQDKEFQPEQLAWLNKIKDQIAQSAEMTIDDFDLIPDCRKDGGLLKARELFGKELEPLINELNGYLIA
jgi:type I restriction enzyme, R subunit